MRCDVSGWTKRCDTVLRRLIGGSVLSGDPGQVRQHGDLGWGAEAKEPPMRRRLLYLLCKVIHTVYYTLPSHLVF